LYRATVVRCTLRIGSFTGPKDCCNPAHPAICQPHFDAMRVKPRVRENFLNGASFRLSRTLVILLDDIDNESCVYRCPVTGI